ncbi:MAG TPA: E3 binding domain-containing protein, partial [Ferruginibacter sp.]|nr:E3 binding domain-containing protein [Ferruginibacter sp.]
MALEIKVPTVGESINEVTLVRWLKADGAWVERDEVIAELESEKATFEINAEKAGAIHQTAKEGDTLAIGDVVGSIDTDVPKPASAEPAKTEQPAAVVPQPAESKPVVAPVEEVKASPVAAAIMADTKVDKKQIVPSGANGKILKQDVMEALQHPGRLPGAELFTRNERAEK